MAITQLKRYFIIALYPLIDKGVFLKPLEITDGHSVGKIKMEVRNLWKKTKLCATAFLLLVLCLCWPSVGGCSPSRTFEISESELQMLEQHLNALEANNEAWQAILNESTEELMASTQELEALKAELQAVKESLTTCRKDLVTLKAESKAAKDSLQTANEELKSASESFKASERERDKIEGRLRTQRNIWEALFAVAVGVAIAK